MQRIGRQEPSIFQLLGGLGLLLGSVGLGVVVLRNVLERRGELAILRAVGFRRRSLRRRCKSLPLPPEYRQLLHSWPPSCLHES